VVHHNTDLSTARLTTETTPTTALAAPSADWQLANQRAQDRIVRLQEQRAREATSVSTVGSFFAGNAARPAFRVGQLDTELLDEELLELLKGQLWNGLKYFRVCCHRGCGKSLELTRA
jgi:peroxin-2